jgi:hypothetical protein
MVESDDSEGVDVADPGADDIKENEVTGMREVFRKHFFTFDKLRVNKKKVGKKDTESEYKGERGYWLAYDGKTYDGVPEVEFFAEQSLHKGHILINIEFAILKQC